MKDIHIGYEMRVVSNLLKRKIFQILPPPPKDRITDTQRRVIDYLYQNRDKEIFQKDIENLLCIRRSTASRMLKSLEEKKIIIRSSVMRDARLKKLSLAKETLTKQNEFHEKVEYIENLLTHGLSDEEITTFINILEKIKANLQ